MQAWLRSDLLPIRQERSTLVVFYGVKSAPLSSTAESAAHKLVSAAQTLLADYAQRQWQRPTVQEWVKLQRPAL